MELIRDDEICVVVDVEADGPFPGEFSMLSLGAVATTTTQEVDTFYANMLPLDGVAQDSNTMAWWETVPEAWELTQTDRLRPQVAMGQFATWLCDLGRTPIFVAQPDVFDYQFVAWYFWKFNITNPFVQAGSTRTLDLRSFTAGALRRPFMEAGKKHIPERFLRDAPAHSHYALDDAREIAAILRNVATS